MADNTGNNAFKPLGYIPEEEAKKIVWHEAAIVLGELKKHPTFSLDEVVVVWFVKSLNVWKALLTTSLPDGRYYELTHNIDTNTSYLDTYLKTHHREFLWVEAEKA